MIRLFLAISLPETVRAFLGQLQAGVPGVTWVPPENLHLTLRFVGEVEEGLAREMDAALSTLKAAPFPLQLDGLGVFSHRDVPHTLWVGVGKSSRLKELKQKIDRLLLCVGLPPEERRYTPHISLGRLKGADPGRLQAYFECHGLLKPLTWSVTEVTLYSSFLKVASAPHYTPEVTYPLQAGTSSE